MKFFISTMILVGAIGIILFLSFSGGIQIQILNSILKTATSSSQSNSSSSREINLPREPVTHQPVPQGFVGPTGEPHIIGPSGNPPNY